MHLEGQEWTDFVGVENFFKEEVKFIISSPVHFRDIINPLLIPKFAVRFFFHFEDFLETNDMLDFE